MSEIKLLKMLIMQLINEDNVKLRTPKGYGGSHPVISHKPFMKGLGSSDYEVLPKKKKKKDTSPVDTSKAFEEDQFEDTEEYGKIIREIINAKKLHR
jgi:hypothetical protein